MKIAVLTPLKFDEAETFIQNHITNLPFEIVVIHGGGFPHLQDSELPSSIDRIQFKVVNKLKKKLGFKSQTFQEYNLTKILKREKVDLVFAEYLITGAETVEVCKKLNIPIIAIALGYEISRYDVLKRYDEKYKSLFNYASKILIVSNHMRKNIETLGCSPEKIVYSPAGPSKDFFKITSDFKKKQIIAIGRFVDKKAPHLTILAFKKVLGKVPDANLVLAGDGMLWNACKDLVKVLGLNDSVSFVGRVNRKEHQDLLSKSYLFVQHSKTAESGDSEGTPVAILEASAAGLPIVSTQHAGIPDVVIDGETGYLVPENDVDLMAKKMIKLLKDENLARQFGKNGREYVQDNFSLKRHIDTLSNYMA